jgi:1,4-dihydroxy-2-naphthoate polyprenyltransferase
MLHRSTIQLLRIPFSFFLMPVFLFSLSQVPSPDWWKAFLCFFILHLIVYPSSNGYNSYMDRDEGSIGGVKQPLAPTRQLFVVSVVLDILAVLLSLFVSLIFAGGILLYIVLSRLYSYRGVRLKRYPLIGYLVVIASQGGLTYWLVYHACHQPQTTHVPWAGVIASSLLIGGFYPLTQVYQHEADKRDGVETISSKLGIRGTFRFSAVVYFLAFSCLAWLFTQSLEIRQFFLLQLLMLPVLIMFFRWAALVWKDPSKADFEHTMRINWVASICTNSAFFILLIWRLFE